MPFINPWVFWTGLGAVSVPILIHLLNRRRFRVKDWAAMKFLLESIRKNRRRLRIEELILLALRCLAILLLALAVARFTGFSAAPSPVAQDGQATNVYVLDDSLSMGQKVGVGTLFNSAAADLAGELERTPATHQVAVLQACLAKTREPVFGRKFLTDSKGLAIRVRALEASDWRMSLSDALAAAGQQLQGASAPRKLYLMSDFRRVDLVGDEQAAAIKRQFAELRRDGVEVIALDYGRPASRNLTIQEVRLLDKFAVAKAPLRISVTVRNNGTAGAGEVEVRPTVRVLGESGPQTVTLPVQVLHDLPPGQSASVEFQVVCQEPGPAVVSVSLPADDLMRDNEAHLALDVRKYIRVLVVDGSPDLSDPAESESFYFVRAVDPRQDGSWGVRPEVVSEDAFAGVPLDDYDAIVMMNVQRLSDELVSRAATRPAADANQPAAGEGRGALERYVREGGGLLVFAGPRVDVNYYNEALWANGAGLLPLRMGATMGRGEPDFVRFDPKGFAADRSLAIFQGEGTQFVELMRFFRYLSAQEASGVSAGEAGPPRVLARFADGSRSPAIAARTFGKGLVTMIYTTGGTRWTDWPTDAVGTFGTFAPVMHALMGELARPQREPTGPVGQPIEQRLPKTWTDAASLLRPPGYPKQEDITLDRPDANAGLPLLRWDPVGLAGRDAKALLTELPSAGVYSLEVKRSGSERLHAFFARNPDPAEGDLAPGGQALLTAAFGSEDFVYRAVKGGEGFGLVEAQAKREYWKYAVAALLAVLAAEVFLAQRFGHYTVSSQSSRR